MLEFDKDINFNKDINDDYELKEIKSQIVDWIMPFFFKCLMEPLDGKISFCLPNINFVFSEEDINEISSYLPDLSENGLRDKLLEMRNNAFNIKETSNINVNDNNVYINVPNYKEFFFMLYKIYTKSVHSFYLGLRRENIINSIWIRMGVEDISDVMGFLQRQLEFIENQYMLNDDYYYGGDLAIWDNIRICYTCDANPEWFETNRCLSFNLSPIESSFKTSYMLPSIHYGLARENEELICYIYGIQNFSDDNDWRLEKFGKEAKRQIKDLRKSFYNPYVSPNFVIALKYFIELLQRKGITTIKVPFFQVFNYDYHVFLSDSYKKNYEAYSESEKLEYEEKIQNDTFDKKVIRYMDIKNGLDSFNDKQDIISRNKIDRFLQVFTVLSEKMENIEVITEPALNGEFYIMVKINNINLDKNISHFPNYRK